MTEDRESIDRDVRATINQGKAVRERAQRELTELDRVLRHEAAPPANKPRERGEERRWWHRFLFA